jgi:hypothetical protein
MKPRRPTFDRTPLQPDRLRRIDGSFAFLPHHFLRLGFWAALDLRERLLYVLLVLVADRQGMSFYGDDRLAALLGLARDDFLRARASLLRRDLVAHDPQGPRYQVLSLPVALSLPAVPARAATPPSPPQPPSPAATPTNVSALIRHWLATHADDVPRR